MIPSSLPLLPGELNGRPRTAVNVSDLNSIGISGSAFSIHQNDVIEFPDEDPMVVSQPIRANDANSNKAYYVAVLRNGKPSWLGIGILTRRDADGKAIGKFQEDMLKYPSFKDVYEALRGKKIKGGTPMEHKFATFGQDGQRDGGSYSRMIPEIEYA